MVFAGGKKGFEREGRSFHGMRLFLSQRRRSLRMERTARSFWSLKAWKDTECNDFACQGLRCL